MRREEYADIYLRAQLPSPAVVLADVPPQGDQSEVDKSCSIVPDVTAKVGLFGKVAPLRLGKLEVEADLDALTFNFPLDGSQNYMTQGAGIGIKHARLFDIPLAVGIDRKSVEGGFSGRVLAPWYLPPN